MKLHFRSGCPSFRHTSHCRGGLRGTPSGPGVSLAPDCSSVSNIQECGGLGHLSCDWGAEMWPRTSLGSRIHWKGDNSSEHDWKTTMIFWGFSHLSLHLWIFSKNLICIEWRFGKIKEGWLCLVFGSMKEKRDKWAWECSQISSSEPRSPAIRHGLSLFPRISICIRAMSYPLLGFPDLANKIQDVQLNLFFFF